MFRSGHRGEELAFEGIVDGRGRGRGGGLGLRLLLLHLLAHRGGGLFHLLDRLNHRDGRGLRFHRRRWGVRHDRVGLGDARGGVGDAAAQRREPAAPLRGGHRREKLPLEVVGSRIGVGDGDGDGARAGAGLCGHDHGRRLRLGVSHGRRRRGRRHRGRRHRGLSRIHSLLCIHSLLLLHSLLLHRFLLHSLFFLGFLPDRRRRERGRRPRPFPFGRHRRDKLEIRGGIIQVQASAPREIQIVQPACCNKTRRQSNCPCVNKNKLTIRVECGEGVEAQGLAPCVPAAGLGRRG